MAGLRVVDPRDAGVPPLAKLLTSTTAMPTCC